MTHVQLADNSSAPIPAQGSVRSSTAGTTHQGDDDSKDDVQVSLPRTLDEAKASFDATEGVYYLGRLNLAALSTFLVEGITGNRLVQKGDTRTPLQFILAGIFQVDPREFWLLPDGGFKYPNSYGNNLCDAKAHCRLVPVSRGPAWLGANADTSAVLKNIAEIEQGAPAIPNQKLLSMVSMLSGTQSIKVSHHFFYPVEVPVIEDHSDDEHDEGSSAGDTSPFEDIPEYDIATWPVRKELHEPLKEIVETHCVDPIPAYDVDGSHIRPADYVKKLRGATVAVHFGVTQHQIMSKVAPKSVMSATIRQMVVLDPPIQEVRSPGRGKKTRKFFPSKGNAPSSSRAT